MTVQAHTTWQYRNPADLIGRRCIALTHNDVTLDGPLDLIRLSPVHAVLKYRASACMSSTATCATIRTKPRTASAPSSSRKANHDKHHIACQEMA